jgi:hypothetical protein
VAASDQALRRATISVIAASLSRLPGWVTNQGRRVHLVAPIADQISQFADSANGPPENRGVPGSNP